MAYVREAWSGMSDYCAADIDFLEHMDQAVKEYLEYRRKDVLVELGAQAFGKEIWDTISDSQPPKQLVRRRATWGSLFLIMPLLPRLYF